MTAFHLGPAKLCDYIADISVIYEYVLEISDLPPKGTCPIPAKIYNINGFITPIEKIPPHMEGDWMFETRILQDDVIVNGYQLSISVIRV